MMDMMDDLLAAKAIEFTKECLLWSDPAIQFDGRRNFVRQDYPNQCFYYEDKSSVLDAVRDYVNHHRMEIAMVIRKRTPYYVVAFGDKDQETFIHDSLCYALLNVCINMNRKLK